MKPRINHHTTFLLAVTLLLGATGCDQKSEISEETKPEAQHENNIVSLSRENLEHVALNTQPAELGNLDMTLKAAGRISANLNKTAKVSSTFEGRLAKLNVDLNGQVKSGDVLAIVESPELLNKPLELKAPIDGVIIERPATLGELVDKSTVVYTVSDPSRLWVIAEIKERDIAAVKTGQDATFTVLPYPKEKFHGKVALVGNQVESGTRTLEVRIEANNEDGRLKPGMFADVEITTTVLENVLLIPDSALQTDGDDQIVFIALDGNRYEKRVVKLGEEQEGHAQVLEGLKAGDKVATDGSFILKSEMLKDELGEE